MKIVKMWTRLQWYPLAIQAGLLFFSLGSVAAKLQAAVILPHGDFALDPTLADNTAERDAADAVAKAAAQVGDWLGHHIDPDLIFLSTPHGITLSNDFGFYLGSTASGGADIGKDLHNATHPSYRVNLPQILLEPRLATELVSKLISENYNVSGIRVSADDSFDVPLQWAEVIPLLLIPQRNKEAVQSSKTIQRRRHLLPASTTSRRHMILSHPSKRYDHAPDMVDELLQLGHKLGQWMEARPEQIAVVISGDMSHTHRANGPYGYSNASAAFDDAVGIWAADPCRQSAALLEQARSLQSRALSCGFTGMVLLHGMLCSGDIDIVDENNVTAQQWDSHVWANRNVTYYGMMVASYERVFESS